jgi:prepilin-type N-terminal cleavage/methylation domain-containing protein
LLASACPRVEASFSMKIRDSNHQSAVQSPLRGRAGMTLVEVMVALAITGLMLAGIVSGYIFCTNSAVKDSLYMAANARAMERMEETRSAIWAPYRAVPTNQLVAANFPDKVVTLDMSGSSTNVVSATIQTAISQISASPPVMRIHVDCIWQFQGAEWVTNSIETCRAPDQ